MGENGLSYNYNGATADGKTVVLTYSKSEGIGFGNIALLNTTNKNVQKIIFDRSAGNFKFSNDNKSLFFTAQANGGQPLYKLDLLTNKVAQITDFESGITNFDLNESKIVYFKTSIENPLELFYNLKLTFVYTVVHWLLLVIMIN